MRGDDDDTAEVVAPLSSVYFQAPRHLGPGLDSFTPGGFPATPVLHVSHPALLQAVQSPLNLEESCDCSLSGQLNGFPREPCGDGRSKLVLLLGCGTFVGLQVAIKLLSSGYSVRIFMLDTASNDQLDTLQASVRGTSKLFVFRGDQLDRAFEDCEFAVIAQLPRRPKKYSRIELSTPAAQEKIVSECIAELRDFFLCAKKYGKSLKRIVHISSAAAVFPVVEPVQRDALSPASRRTLLKEVEHLANRADIPLVSLLPSIVIGAPTCFDELSDAHFHLLRLASSWFPLVPKLRFNLVSVRDVAEAVFLVLEHPAAEGQRYLISDQELSVRDISDVLHKAGGGSLCRKWELPNVATLLLTVCGFLRDYSPVGGPRAFRYLKRNLDRSFRLSSAKSSRDLGLRTTDVQQALADCIVAPSQRGVAAATSSSTPSHLRAASQESNATLNSLDLDESLAAHPPRHPHSGGAVKSSMMQFSAATLIISAIALSLVTSHVCKLSSFRLT